MVNQGGEVKRLEDPYVTLGVATDASQPDIARAYRRLAHLSHPGSRPDDPGASARFQALSSAYGILGDPQRRAQYDRAQAVGARERLQDMNGPSRDMTSRSVRMPVSSSLHAGQGSGQTLRPPSPPIWVGPVFWRPSDPRRVDRSMSAVDGLARLPGLVARSPEYDPW